MWAELLFFVVVLGLAVQQLYAVKKAQRKTAEDEAARRKADVDQPPNS